MALDETQDYCRSYLISQGNSCGHNPLVPRFFEPNPKHANRPDVLQWARANLERFYLKPQSWLNSLRLTRTSSRQERSEGRERDADVLGVLLHYTELASLRVGVPQSDGTFVSLSMKFIAKQLMWRTDEDDRLDAKQVAAGKEPLNRGIKRVWRSICSLKQAGYLTVHRRYKKLLEGEQDYVGLPAVRCIQPKLFWELGINGTKLKAKRDQATKRLKKQYGKYREQVEATLKATAQAMLGFVGVLNGAKKGRSHRSSDWAAEQRVAQEKARLARYYELKQHPENQALSLAAFYAKYPDLRPPDSDASK